MAQETMQTMVNGIREYAVAHYEEGWDIVVECYDDAEIIEQIGKTKTLSAAIKKFGHFLGIRKAYVDDIINS